MNHKILRSYIRRVLLEVLEGPHISNVLSHGLVDREPMRSLADEAEISMASHLLELEVDMEDCYGPVPPTSDDPGVFADPYTRFYHVLPTAPARSRAKP